MDMRTGRRFKQLLGAGAVLAVAGCASVPRSDMQTLEIEVVTPAGVAVPGAQCRARNAAGEWAAAAPGKVTLSSDASALQLRCEAGAMQGEASVNAQVRGARWQRGLVGGGIGLAVGGLIGARSDAKDKSGLCCGNLGAMVGAVLGTALGSGLGAGTADPHYAYPAKLRVVLQPDGPPR